MTAPASTTTRTRMRGEERRQQLIDAAATIVVEFGSAAMTMERLAAQAGVSKALPYKHFDNSDQVLTELYRRETSAIARAVWRALRDAASGSDLVRVGVHVYLDEVIERRPVLSALSKPGSTIVATADPAQAGIVFEVEVLDRFHGIGRERAKQIAGIVQGAVVGAANTLHAGHGSRDALENDLVAVIGGLIRS
jgi:AcrR family transcriptional regulator